MTSGSIWKVAFMFCTIISVASHVRAQQVTEEEAEEEIVAAAGQQDTVNQLRLYAEEYRQNALGAKNAAIQARAACVALNPPAGAFTNGDAMFNHGVAAFSSGSTKQTAASGYEQDGINDLDQANNHFANPPASGNYVVARDHAVAAQDHFEDADPAYSEAICDFMGAHMDFESALTEFVVLLESLQNP